MQMKVSQISSVCSILPKEEMFVQNWSHYFGMSNKFLKGTLLTAAHMERPAYFSKLGNYWFVLGLHWGGGGGGK